MNKITIIGSFLLLSTLQCFGMEPKDQLFINAALLNTIAQEAQQVLHDEETALEVNATDETALGKEIGSKRRRYECPACKKSIFNLAEHMRIHTGEKPYQCDQCAYSSAHRSNLTKHMRSHSGEKPFTCKQCNYSFAYGSDLTRHMLIHTGEKPFKCKQCDYSCTQNGTLIDHQRTHTGEKPFQCNQCDCSFTKNSNLTRHKRKHI